MSLGRAIGLGSEGGGLRREMGWGGRWVGKGDGLREGDGLGEEGDGFGESIWV